MKMAMKSILFIILAMFFCSVEADLMAGQIIYVDASASGANTGLDWLNAYKTINQALGRAVYGDQIWVADGTYRELITITNGVALYGGFAGGEGNINQRDYLTHYSIIDANSLGCAVTITMADPNTGLDGFVVMRGKAIFCGGVKLVASAAVIANNLITGNLSNGLGAGIYSYSFYPHGDLQPLIINNTIVDNFAYDDEGNGGGIACHGSSPTITGNVIARNFASRNGGGITCYAAESDAMVLCSSPIISNNFILANAANILIGDSGMQIGGGGIHCTATDTSGDPIIDAVCEAVIINNVIAANGGWKGGGICAVDSLVGSVTIANNTIVANSGAGIYYGNTSPVISNNIVSYNTWGIEEFSNIFTNPVFKNNCVYGNIVKGKVSNFFGITDPTGTNGNISENPLLADFKTGQFHIQPDSPCKDSGDANTVGPGWFDIDYQNRILGTKVDIGADESDGTKWNVERQIVYVKTDGNDLNSGLSWATAKKTITAGINKAASIYGEVWVKQGTYLESITLPASTYVYGGFNGTETEREQRDFENNLTVIDANHKGNVISCINCGFMVSQLDGFTITNGSPLIQNMSLVKRGGGIWIVSCSPEISNNIISNNDSDDSMWPTFMIDGGGIYCYMSYPAIIDNNIVGNAVNNYPDGRGGGIYSYWSMPTISSNIIRNNIARAGSAIYTEASEAFIYGNNIENNSGHPLFGTGMGTIACYACEDYEIIGNTIRSNLASSGGGIMSQACFKGKIINNLIIGNWAYEPSSGSYGSGGGIYLEIPLNAKGMTYVVNNTICDNVANTFIEPRGGGIALTPLCDKVILANNIITYNSSGIFQPIVSSDIATLNNNCVYNYNSNYLHLSPGPNDIWVDPNFANRPAGNYRLTSGSLCIDRADNPSIPAEIISDIAGLSRFIDDCTIDTGSGLAPLADIGSFEFLRSDINSDSKVDFTDLAVFALHWLETNCGTCSGAELTCDGKVDTDDLEKFCETWLTGLN